MIIVQLKGGLGNQFFQYATAYALAKKQKTILLYDTLLLKERDYRKLGISKFDISAKKASLIQLLFADWNYIWIVLYRIFKWSTYLYFRHKRQVDLYESYFKRVLRPLQVLDTDQLRFRSIVSERFFHFDENLLQEKSPLMLFGYWLNERYFNEVRSDLLKEFNLRDPLSSKSKIYLKQIHSCNSVSLHIRRGDFLSSDHSSIFISIPLHYYFKALEYFTTIVYNPVFFIFSDDIDWVKSNLSASKFMKIFVEYEDEFDSTYEEFYLMSQCKHNITANSSFSWWAAWVNNNPKKIVVTPSVWYNLPSHQTDSMIPDSWTKLSVYDAS
jgi:hypothetical protein